MSGSAYLRFWAQPGAVGLERCWGTKEVMRAGLERALQPIWLVEAGGWSESWGVKRLGGVEGEVGGVVLACFL